VERKNMRKGNLEADLGQILLQFDIESVQLHQLSAKSNVKTRFEPGDNVYAIMQTPKGRTLTSLRWGFHVLKPWTLYTAKIETASLKLTWRESYNTRRCIVPFTTAYAHDLPIEIPNRIMAVAGIYNTDGSAVSILTTESTGELVALKPRQPVVVPEELWPEWLDPTITNPDSFRDRLLRDAPLLHSAF